VIMFYVYIIQSQKDGRLYKGFTSNLEKRIKAHNQGEVKSTRNRRPFKLVYQEEYESKKEALQREKFLKSLQGAKTLRNTIKLLPGSSVGRAGGCVMQLPREIVVEKSGEFREAYPSHQAEHGNPEPSPELSQFREGAETRASARTLRDKSEGKRPTPSAQFSGRVMR
jgi:putative endonuclease